ncbi:MAG: transcriptional repressor [Lactobacillaceae bacterium]|jgi:Fur family peroxide stress response transcriptional regulator|nr:transcriptional repressor [Lactobacillaceae bacterium]
MNKYSRQRELILRTLEENKIHPSADTVYEMIRKLMPNISLATVYRNLNLLAEKGVIKRLEGVDGIYRYDADISEHYHFVCKKCGNIIDIQDYAMPEIIRTVSERTGLQIEDCDVTFKGICSKCITKN